MLNPVHFMGDDYTTAGLEVFEAARVGVSLGVHEVLVVAVGGHTLQVMLHALFIVPV